MDTLFTIFEIMGTLAFAISGALDAIRHRMDLFGVGMMGIVTATGGGMLRDLVIGQTPPKVFRNPRWAIMAFIAALVTFVVLKLYHKKAAPTLSRLMEKLFLLSERICRVSRAHVSAGKRLPSTRLLRRSTRHSCSRSVSGRTVFPGAAGSCSTCATKKPRLLSVYT